MEGEFPRLRNTNPQIYRVVVTLSFTLFLLIFIVAIFFYLQRIEKTLDSEYINNAKLENQLNDLLSNLQDAETGQRGYLLTFNDAYLEPYHAATSSNQKILDEIAQNAEVSTIGSAKLVKLRKLITEKYAELEQTIFLHKDDRHSEAINLVNTDQGKLLMDSIRLVIQSLREVGKKKLADNIEDTNQIHQIINVAIVGFGILVTGLLFYIFWVIHPLFMRLDEVNKILIENNKLIASKNQQLEEFAYITSHDLKEPIRTILSFVQLFERKYSTQFDQTAREYFHFILDATRRMEKMISSILNYSQLGGTVAFVEVDLNHTIQEIKNDLNLAIRETNATIHGGRLPTIVATETEIRLLFQNLISNAIKFRRKNAAPVIKISYSEDNLYWRFFIRDNGIGIPEKKLNKIFGVFTKLHSPSEYEGQGIGLAFCKKIVEFHGGIIEVESSLEAGSTFSFTISKNLNQKKQVLKEDLAHQ